MGTRIALPQPVDRDSKKFALTRYTLVLDSFPTKVFGLRVERRDVDYNYDFAAPASGVSLSVMQPLDREMVAVYNGCIIATDAMDPRLPTSVLNFTVLITDVNDNTPQFTEQLVNISIDEGVLRVNNVSKLLLHRCLATDPDEGLNGMVHYYFDTSMDSKRLEDYFTLDTLSGELWLQKDLDFEQHKEFLLKIIAADKGSSVLQTSTATVSVIVNDINDNPPSITISALSSSELNNVTVIWVPENTSPETFLAQITVFDPDPGGRDSVTCTISCDAIGQFLFVKRHPLKYHLLVSPLSPPLDREFRDTYDVIITCSDASASVWPSSTRSNTSLIMTSERLIQVKVTDENDHAPLFTAEHYVATIIENNFEDNLILEVIRKMRKFCK